MNRRAWNGVPEAPKAWATLRVKYLTTGFTLPGWATERITFRSGKEEAALTAQKITLAPIRTRFRWFVRQGGETAYCPRHAYVTGAHMRGHLQVLAAVQGASEPIVITFKGKASQSFESLQKDFGTKVVLAANSHAPKGKSLPRYAFWMTISPGPHAKAGNKGQESVVTLPTLGLPDDITHEYLRSLYVGRDNLIRFQTLFKEAEPRVNAWEKGGAEHAALVLDALVELGGEGDDGKEGLNRNRTAEFDHFGCRDA